MRRNGHALKYWSEPPALSDEPPYRFASCPCGWSWEWEGEWPIREAARRAYRRHLVKALEGSST